MNGSMGYVWYRGGHGLPHQVQFSHHVVEYYPMLCPVASDASDAAPVPVALDAAPVPVALAVASDATPVPVALDAGRLVE
jgi:hypothetical protein